jgi:hypothetical protein
MRRMTILTLAAAAAAAVPATAQTPVPVAPFTSVELRGGGSVTVRHGPRQSVTLVRGTTEMTRFTVGNDGKLRIDACVRSCRNYDLRVEIVTPRIDGLAIAGGGTLRTEGDFPSQRSLAAAVNGGGVLDSRSVAARDVAASVNGGGAIRTRATGTLAASVNGGGAISYWGEPTVTQAVRGGGAVTRGR